MIEKQLLKDEPLYKREETLRDSCYKVYEDEIYTRPLDTEEIEKRKTDLFEADKKILD